jgi:hypothetical protein
MTKYLQPGPFSGPTSNGKLTDLEYQIAVGTLVKCPACDKYFPPDTHACLGCGRDDCGFGECECK